MDKAPKKSDYQDMPLDLPKALQVATALAQEAGQKLRAWETAVVTKRKDEKGLDFATNLDEEIESHLVRELAVAFPDTGFVVEEDSNLNKEAEYQWVIDPIDGTKYFASGIPLFCVAIGLTRNQQPILGVIYNPSTNQLYAGAEGLPATLNGQPVSVAPTEELARTMVVADWSNLPDEWEETRDWILKKLGKLADAAYRVRTINASQLAMAWLAAGAVTNAFVHLSGVTKPVDVVAGIALCEAAGAIVIVEDHPITQRPLVIVGKEKIARALRDIIFEPTIN